MAIAPQDFYSVGAQFAGGNPADEAGIRTGVGRFYYAAFLLARSVALKQGCSLTGKAEDHGRVKDHFEKRNRVVWNSLKNLRRKRNQADYDIHQNMTPMALTTAKQWADRVFDELTT
jgi:hypothetical protein